MTVSELIAALSRFDQDMRVVVAGFDEAGFDDPSMPYVVETECGERAVMIDFKSEPEPYRDYDDDTMGARIREILASNHLNGNELLPDQRRNLEMHLERIESQR